jgi:DNA-binding MarR family transcriptional regulator
MRNDDAQSLAFGLLAASRALVDGVSAGVRARGFGDVRPAHGFAFSLLSAGGATITQLAEHLDLTRQAAAQLVDELIAKGYVERQPHPRDARARLIVLTPKGRACTHAAEAAIADTLRAWEAALGPQRLLALRNDLLQIAPGGPLRPTW